MSRYPKGILGVPKNPSNQILFSFRTREGEEWPSDEDDSDYNPRHDSDSDNAAGQSTKKRQKKKNSVKKPPNASSSSSLKRGKSSKSPSNQSCRKRQKRSKVKEEEHPEVTAGLQTEASLLNEPLKPTQAVEPYRGRIPTLPPEVLEKIFSYVVSVDGALPFLDSAGKVCRLWKDVSLRPHLWKNVDFGKAAGYGWKCPTTKSGFTGFLRKRCGSCKKLNVSNCCQMAKTWAVQAIADFCPNLQSINLSYCRSLPNGSLDKLINNCAQLEDIDISYTTSDCVSPQTIENIAKKCGENLKRLVFSHNMCRSFSSYIKNLMAYCPNLQHLDISNLKLSTDSISLDIEDLQQHFPRMKSLYISNTPVRAVAATRQQQDESPGFPDLEEFSVAGFGSNFVTSDLILRVLKNSTKLRLLDLRGCSAPRAIESLLELVASNLEQLFLGRSGAQACFELKDIIRKWRHSLTHLDLSWMTFKDNILEETLEELAGTNSQNTVLKNLDLTGASVQMQSLRMLLLRMPNLSDLGLSSCRDLDRGCKRQYIGLQDVQNLRDMLNIP